MMTNLMMKSSQSTFLACIYLLLTCLFSSLLRLWEDGWKDRYYVGKFSVGPEDQEFRYKVVSVI
jgi:hypothetical protein